MAKTVILETHVLYDIGLNRVDIEDILLPGERLCYSPISVLEWVSKLNERSFEDRKAAANAILEHGIGELPDPESHLTMAFGYKLAEPAPSFADAVRALAKAKSLEEAQRGVPDDALRVWRNLNVSRAMIWREKAERAWRYALISLMKENIPGFQKWYAKDPKKRSSSVPKLRSEEKEKFLSGMKSEELSARVISACQMRAFAKADKDDLRVVSKQRANELAAAIPKIACYTQVYKHYLIRLMTEGLLPDENDRADIDFFLYSTDDDHVIATHKKKWIDLAEAARFAQRIRMYGLRDTTRIEDQKHSEKNSDLPFAPCADAVPRSASFVVKDRKRSKEKAARYRNKMHFEDYLEPRPGIRGGKICFKDTRITVYDVLEYLDRGMTEDELLVDFPTLTQQHIRAARDFATVYNAGTAQVADLLLKNKNRIATFLARDEDALLTLNLQMGDST